MIVELFSLVKGNAKLFALGVLIVVLTISISEIYLYNQFQNANRPDWKQAFAAVQERSKVGDLVVTTRPELGEYYMKEELTHVNGLNIDTIGDGNEHIWFVIDNATGWVYPEMKKWVIQNGEFIDIIEVYLPGRSLSIYIYLYDPYIEMSCIIFDMSNIYSF